MHDMDQREAGPGGAESPEAGASPGQAYSPCKEAEHLNNEHVIQMELWPCGVLRSHFPQFTILLVNGA